MTSRLSGEVTVSNQTVGSARSVRADPFRVLEEIKRLAVEQLGNLPGSLYEPTEAALNATLAGTEQAQQYQDHAALWVLRQHHASHVMRYRQHVAQGFDDFRALRIRSRGELPLGLVDETQLEFHLAGQKVGDAIEQRFMRQLQLLDARLHGMADMLGVPFAANPIGPGRLLAAFIETFVSEQVPALLRAELFRQYELELTRLLGEMYDRVNALLVSSGFDVPGQPGHGNETSGRGDVRGDGNRQGGNGGGADGMGVAAGAVSGSNAGGGSPWTGAEIPNAADLGELRGLLRAWREARMRGELPEGVVDAASRRAPSMGRRELRVDEVVSVASLLQREPPDTFARALAGNGRLGEAIRERLNDGSRRLGLNPEQTRFSNDEEDAIDMVALLFDSLFQNHDLEERARRLYARLVLPFVKLALTDGGLFEVHEHPARRLLDVITEACAGNNAETPQERELLDRAALLSQRVVAEYNQDLAVFELAHAELDGLLQQQRRRIELQEERAAKTVLGRERLNQARERADSVVARRLAAPPVSHAVAEFLSTSWRHHLVQTLLRDGAGPGRYAEAVSLGDALVTADRLSADGRGRELADRLLALEPAIVECLASSGLDDSAAQHGMALLVKTLAWPDAPRDLHPAPPSSVIEDSVEEARQWLVEGAVSLTPDPTWMERLAALQPGDGLQLTDRNGDIVATKLAWTSPLTGRMLLVNNRGLRVLVASKDELAALGVVGRLQFGGGRNAFEEAMRHVREQLDNETRPA